MSAPLLSFVKRAPGRSRDSAPRCTWLRRSLHADASARNVLDEPTRGHNRLAATLVHSACPAGHHPQQNPVTSNELMVEGARGVQAGEGEQGIGQQLVNFLR